jgi:hypothetical protein
MRVDGLTMHYLCGCPHASSHTLDVTGVFVLKSDNEARSNREAVHLSNRALLTPVVIHDTLV